MLSAEQILVLGLVATALTFVLRVLATYANLRLGRVVVNVILFVVATGLGVVWSNVTLPPFSDNIAVWVGALLQMVTPIVGIATLIYNLLYEKVVVPAEEYFSK